MADAKYRVPTIHPQLALPIGRVWEGPRVWEGLFLLQNQINQGGYIAHVDFAVAVDVAHGVGVGAAAEDFVDEGGYIAHVDFAVAVDVAHGVGLGAAAKDVVNRGSNVAHVHFAIAIDVAGDLRVEVNINMSNTAGLEAR